MVPDMVLPGCVPGLDLNLGRYPKVWNVVKMPFKYPLWYAFYLICRFMGYRGRYHYIPNTLLSTKKRITQYHRY